MRFLIAFVAVWFACLTALAEAPQAGLDRSDAPAWVEDVAIPALDAAIKAQAQDGVHFILSDRQVRWEDGAKVLFARTVSQVTDRAGLERAATISFDYNPEFDRIILTRLMIIRDGQEIDLRDVVREEVLRREQRLEQGIIDGTLTAWMQIPDLRVGDIIDSASIRIIKPLAPAGDNAVVSFLDWSVPVQLTRLVVLWPQDWALNVGPLPEGISHVATALRDQGVVRLEWQRLNKLPARWEAGTPAGQSPDALVQLSADADFGALSGALTPYYAADYPLTPEWDARVAAIAAASDDPEIRAIAALRLVQDELRYVSLSVGAGGIYARLPQEVLTSGFGDCKDKSLLLVVILRRLGVDAVVALTDIDAGQGLRSEVQRLSIFDHMIVRIMVDGRAHWADPTALHQGGDFTTGAPADYGWGLPLTGPKQRALEPMPITGAQAWSTDVTEDYVFTPAGVMLAVTSAYRGGAADSMRQRWALEPGSKISADYHAYYDRRYPGITMRKEIIKTDDRSANELVMEEAYFLPITNLRGTEVETYFPLAAENFAANLPKPVPGRRSAALDTGRPAQFRHTVKVMGAPLDFAPPPDEVVANRAFTLRFAGKVGRSGSMTLTWEYDRSGNVVPAQDVAALLKDAERVDKLTWFTWDVSPNRP